jgi:hypothetical protein
MCDSDRFGHHARLLARLGGREITAEFFGMEPAWIAVLRATPNEVTITNANAFWRENVRQSRSTS